VVPIGDLQQRGPCVRTAKLQVQSATFTT
jgi:hypothetical protein